MTTTTPPRAAIPRARSLPRGVRNNNAGNLRHGDDWQGLSATQTDQAFCQFDDPVYGLRALMRVLLNYRRKYGIRTVAQAITRWAPPNENDTAAYVASVARKVGVGPDAAVDWTDPAVLIAMTRAIVTHENGRAPADSPADWYDVHTYRRAAEMALGRSVQLVES